MNIQNKTRHSTRFFFFYLIISCTLLNNPSFAATLNFCNIKFSIIHKRNHGKNYIWLHGDEKTAKQVLLSLAKKNTGKFFLIQSHHRLVKINGYTVDPNRIFSDTGVRNTLKKYNPRITTNEIKKIVTLIQKKRPAFIAHILPAKKGILIALHNNQYNYSILDEKKNSVKTSIKNNQSKHNFFLCTSKKDFEILENSQYNVALQNHIQAIDDGSLSQLMARKKRRYINIEARLGAKDIQQAMLHYVEKHIKS